MLKLKVTAMLLATSSVLASCAVPPFNIPGGEFGPTINTIYQRIKCELVELIKTDDYGNDNYKHRQQLLAGNFATAMSISLNVADTGALTPSLNFPAVGSNLAVNAGLNLTRTRTHNFQTKRHFSMVELHNEWKEDRSTGLCPEGVTYDLAGDLGIKELVDLGFSAPGLMVDNPFKSGGVFGGSIEFGLTRNVNSAGPTWTLTNFRGPGNLGRLERKNTNKLTIAFARGPDVKADRPTPADFKAAADFLFELRTIEDD